MDRIKYLKWIAEESPTTAQQLLAWLNRARNYTPDMKEHQAGVQIQEKGIVVGLRQSTNCYEGDCLTIHVVKLPEEIQNKGWFKSFLKLCCESNPWCDVVIEDVKNPHLFEFCKKLNFTVIDKFYPDTFIVNTDAIMSLPTPPLGSYEAYLD
ncbi:hypothetical protein QJC73_003528 [Salmonella enterica]|nr:hypothetical protein [Escherichia coli]EIB5899004.1 hypothetical protein [Salmonella enterica subsp. enterica serovar Montevideo]EKQ2101774.1 hypothetical protein [Salmonella enterica]EFI5675594.1 hypothetical protein [Escherichia coli]EFK3568537.1 hypothetical protein [Escherichia coli]